MSTKRTPDSHSMSRRWFLTISSWGTFLITLGTSLVALVRFLYPRVLFLPPTSFNVGYIEDYKGELPDAQGVVMVDERWKKDERIWVVREVDKIYAIYARCTHLGCTPNWFEDERVFKCPCHGSQFYSNGVNFAGPAPRPLDRCKITLSAEGQIVVDTSVLYLATKANWDKPPAVLPV